MKSKSVSILAIAAALCVLPMKPAFGQDSTAGQEMHKSGEAIESAGAAAGESAKHAYRGTVNQMSDATLTTKVKTALLRDHRARKYSIHVESDRGRVTIDGAVGSRSDANHVRAVVAAVGGVSAVDNKLTWPTS